MGHTELKRDEAIVPILSLNDVSAGISLLMRVFGFDRFRPSGAWGTFMSLGDQKILILPRMGVINAMRPHHLALRVPDVDAAMKTCLMRGGILARSMTPNGPLEIPEFWGSGVRYVFFEGPEGALIELCMKKGQAASDVWGHDHIGIQCDDVSLAQVQLENAGCQTVANHVLRRDDGETEVVFMARGSSVAEAFGPATGKSALDTPYQTGWVGCLYT